MKTLCKSLLVISFAVCATNIFSQQPARNQGLDFYKKGDFQNAILNLKQSDAVEDLYYLGAAYEKIGETENAKGAYKKALAKSYEVYFGKFDQWQKSDFSGESKSFFSILQDVKLNNAIGYAAAEKAFALKSGIFQTNEWRMKAKILFDTAKFADSEEKIYFAADESIESMQIKEKPRSEFPKDMSGTPIAPINMHPNLGTTISLFVIFGSDGQTKLIIPMDRTITPMTFTSMTAAGKIKYSPATKDKKAVAVYSRVQYSFKIG